MTIIHKTHRTHGQKLLMAGALLIGGCITILWSWNTLAVGLFAAPEFQFKHALALVLPLFVLASGLGFAFRLGLGAKHRLKTRS